MYQVFKSQSSGGMAQVGSTGIESEARSQAASAAQDGSYVTIEWSNGGSSSTTATFNAPTASAPVPAGTPTAQPSVPNDAVSYADFLRLLTTAERVGIRTAAQTNMVIEDYMDLAQAQGYVKLHTTEAQQGLGYLAQQGLITEARLNEILS